MANRYVRRTVESWIANYMVTPYYQSVALDPAPIDPVWCSIDWGFAFPRRITFCNEQLQEGNFQLVFFGRAGLGDDDLLTQAEADIELLKTAVDPTHKLVLESFSAPDDFVQEQYYGVSFTIEYTYAT